MDIAINPNYTFVFSGNLALDTLPLKNAFYFAIDDSDIPLLVSFITMHDDWKYGGGFYKDYGDMLTNCRSGTIDIIVCKSIIDWPSFFSLWKLWIKNIYVYFLDEDISTDKNPLLAMMKMTGL